MKNENKFIALGFFFLAAILYIARYALAVCLYPSIMKDWSGEISRLDYALKTVGPCLFIWAIIALLVGLFYFVKNWKPVPPEK